MRNEDQLPPDEVERLTVLHALGLLDAQHDATFDRVVRLAAHALNVPLAWVALVDRTFVWLKAAYGTSISGFPREGSLSARALRHGGLLEVEDNAAEVGNEFALLAGSVPVCFAVCVPLHSREGRALGVFCVADHDARTLDAVQRQTLVDLAAILDDRLAVLQRASQDLLTTLPNRRGFKLLAKQTLAACLRHGHPAALVLLDLKGLKHINDSRGRGEGDLALLAAADLLVKVFRGSDSVARLGDNQFAVFIANVTGEQAERVFSRFARALQRYNEDARRGYRLDYLSVVIEFNAGHHATIERLLQDAENAMYTLKGSQQAATRQQ